MTIVITSYSIHYTKLYDEVEAFFVPFAERIVETLNRIGYPLCHGKVMVNNPTWRGRLHDWQARIRDWVNDPEPQKVRYSSIFFDFVPLAGDPELAGQLRDIVHRELRNFPGFLYHMMSLDLRYKVPVGLLGRFLLVITSYSIHYTKLYELFFIILVLILLLN